MPLVLNQDEMTQVSAQVSQVKPSETASEVSE